MITPADTIVVREVRGEAEIEAFHRCAVMAFSSDPDIETSARREQADLEGWPDYRPGQRRGAFRGETLVGGYLMLDRWLRVGASYLSTGCIGGVATHPGHRLQGVGSALMNDAIAEADTREHGLLLLMGIPNFYHRFGYADVLDVTEGVIDRSAVPTTSPAEIILRPATLADAGTLLAVYERHCRGYTGPFARTIELQTRHLKSALADRNPPVLAFDQNGQARGYLLFRTPERAMRAIEVAADTWPAASALLQHHSQVLASLGDPTSELIWPLAPDSPTFYHLADNLAVADTSAWGMPTRGWAVRSQTYHHPRAGWLARPISLRRILESLRPVWHTRLCRALLPWCGMLVLTVGDESCAIEVGPESAEVLDETPADAPSIALAPDRFIQLVFGYRPVSYVASQPGSTISRELAPVLEILFPTGHVWIPGTDGF